ncbi:hypothetical protein [Lacinutrix himadriensis]|uniref:hypothetical protein n=1 Tax=Lacinutrix himadriensis TaxID=641549 RepID=UPI0006E1604B|nr:hypothetical protein [Lacinutrix himadriensis]
MRDAYNKLFEKINREDFFKLGLDDIIYIEENEIMLQWEKLKNNVLNNKEVFIRGYSRDARKTNYYITLYMFLFKLENVIKDPSNNTEPTKLIASLTNYIKTPKKKCEKELLSNYQISHLFGRTKNPLLFNCSWNIAYIPKYLDPFTGHETRGEHSMTFKKVFKSQIENRFLDYIIDYNDFITKYVEPNLQEALDNTRRKLRIDKKEFGKFEKDARKELSKIELEDNKLF